MTPDRIDYLPIITRPKLTWPGGKRIALWVVPNVEFYEYLPQVRVRNPWPRMPHPDVLGYGLRDYGNRVGLWRMIEVLDHYKLPITVSLNLANYEALPRHHAGAGIPGDWEIRATASTIPSTSGICRSTRSAPSSPSASPRKTADRPRPSRLVLAGRLQHRQYRRSRRGSRHHLLQRLVSRRPADALQDQNGTARVGALHDGHQRLLLTRTQIEGEEFAQMAIDQFDQLYRDAAPDAQGHVSGRVMCVALHPFIMWAAVPHQAPRPAVAPHPRQDGVWPATGLQIARHYIDHHLPTIETHLAAEAPFARRMHRATEGPTHDPPLARHGSRTLRLLGPAGARAAGWPGWREDRLHGVPLISSIGRSTHRAMPSPTRA